MESWEKILAVQHMQDYIEEHLTEPITLLMLSKAAGYSPWHSARIFKELTGKAPFEYIRALRLSWAAVKLHDQDVKIIDVAFDFVFDSHEGFTRAFSKQFGMTPKYYSKNTPPLKLFLPGHARDYYLTLQKGDGKVSKNLNTVFVQVVDRPARKLILKRGMKAAHYFEYCEEVGCEVWNILSGIKEALYEPIGMWLPENLKRPGTSVYAQGVEVPVNYTGKVPEGYELMELPPCKMMVFQGPPFDDEKFEEAIGELWTVMKNYNPEIYGFKWADEDGPRFQLAPMGYRGYIEARPVRQINV
ncbi:helix-turn-helix domain-containing protein [Candidatus Formimonas warabiya]|uniref:AraC family transcriptional regulator n=1 Tax=Formimonas warabiya TaxID=1761012 RepID=A0A3G1KWJ3_FORW1|nr:AraC family transcriptional regulator [Candidatus Formimonas warabiya]ATW26844.1 AraC family transcriptional regulator [Candidatus Formimonas warabiya]